MKAAEQVIKSAQMMSPIAPLNLAADGLPAPSACPTRIVIAALNASGIMKLVIAKLIATWWPGPQPPPDAAHPPTDDAIDAEYSEVN